MQEHPVLFHAADGVATITLNRPETLNAMNNGLMQGITDSLKTVERDHSIRAVIITGQGRGFCAGADLVGVANKEPGPSNRANESSDARDGDDTFNTAVRSLMNCPVPTIARINGPAAGGGFGLALACDVTIAGHSAFFVATFGPKLGIVPDMGATWNIPRRVGRARALGLTLLGTRLSAADAERWGLIWQSVPDDNLDQAVADVVAILKRSSPATATRIRQTIDAALDNDFSDQLELEMTHQAVLVPRNMQAGARAFLAKKEPTFGPERD
jgi:2-(1,2-epoxy-1,2-dihydrophenyl)acetyl-CoA isomerase